MPPSERNALPSVGAAFWREAGAVLFTFVIDPGNVIGPRAATQGDQEKHPGAWAAFLRSEERSPLDRDAKDGAGGSLKADLAEAAAIETEINTPIPGTVAVVTADGSEHPTVAAAAKHASTLPPKRKYTKRKG